MKKAEALMAEALESIERREAASKSQKIEDDELAVLGPGENRESEPIAKIDLKQYVDKETYLRLAADFENFRNRALKERVEADRAGRERILRGFLEILDNLERGLAQAKTEPNAIVDGIRIILSQIDAWLKAEGLTRVETCGKPFDPQVHDAISQMDSDLPRGTVVEEIKRGYTWGNRLLRPATVVVSRGRTSST